jgi:transcriptional regulator with XRE-family HTH domain
MNSTEQANAQAEYLKNFLTTQKVRQTALANAIGVTPSLIGQWLRGERTISVAKAVEIEKLYHLDAALLSADVKLARDSMKRKH